MKFNDNVPKKYRKMIKEAFKTILEVGNDRHKRTAKLILDSDMLICAGPVSDVQASGITGVIDPSATNKKIARSEMSLNEALGEVFITLAYETMNTAKGTEGTLVHEGEHALDFARTIESFSAAAINPLSIYDPTHYEMEWTAHVAAAEFMLQMDKPEYLQEGVDLMVLGRRDEDCFVFEDGIKERLRNSYGMEESGNVGPLASEMALLVQR